MAADTDRIARLLGGRQRNLREIVSPEGVALEVEVADHGERVGAFAIDFLLWLAVTILLYLGILLAILHGVTSAVAITAILFIAFIVRNLYFVYFELAWQGSTPGKKLMGLRVIDRQGGPLTPAALIARNLTREVEIFLPIGLLLSLSVTGEGTAFWQKLCDFAWVALISCLPFFNRDHLRAGDLIGGTMVIALPRRALLGDLAVETTPYAFSSRQLAAYGAFELQVLEELLRRPDSPETRRLLDDVCTKICRKIGWTEPVRPGEAPAFLKAFYAAERAELERARLFGRHKADKHSKAGETTDG
ncbi:RDD family protein [Labrys wisconsinensis]|uniref:RDD family membrane protein YckC n=1 Tax=Labrys wisconsinensis TaxID=425677 RepID=A0ABU0J9I8_9HYPH|nr:RDD family protein [Labrys wisconsinensis]MDQ0470935.1 putative RDD family membrane protein YckC [Labrys wisconsinensis]